jgi:hypothetical protein
LLIRRPSVGHGPFGTVAGNCDGSDDDAANVRL